jgi:hypothetical protein
MKINPAFLAIALALFAAAIPAAAQYGTDKKQQAFDYTPESAGTSQLSKEVISTDYEDAEMVNDPIRGVFMISKSRWKSWVERAGYILMFYTTLVVIIFSLSKTEEPSIFIAYALAGVNAVLSFWVLLCAWLLWRLNASAWLLFLPLSLVMAAIDYLLLMKISRSDLSLIELKESFLKMNNLSKEDLRLISVEGQPGDWPNQDFIR